MALTHPSPLPRLKADDAWKVASGALAVLALTYLAFPHTAVGRVVFTLTGTMTAFALVYGPRHFGVKFRRPWTTMAAGIVCVQVGVLLRPVGQPRTGPAWQLDHAAFAMAGYALVLLGLVALALRAWRGHQMKYVTLDGLMITLGAASLSLAVLSLPALDASGPWWRSAMAASYPIFDVLFLLALVGLGFTTAARLPAFRILLAATASMLLTHVAHSYLASRGTRSMPEAFDVPILVAVGLVGVAALHPSNRGYNGVRVTTVAPWDHARVALIAVAVVLPAAGLLIPHSERRATDILLAAGAASVALCLLWRAVAAVNAQAQIQADLAHRATHDPLTQLGNRDLLQQEVTAMLERVQGEETVSVLYLDVDGFKFVNDSYGHTVGDEVLLEIGRRLTEVVAREAGRGGLATRIGGDEFAVAVCDDTAGADGEQLAAALVSAFKRPLRLSVGRFDASISIGMANSGALDAPTFEMLLRDADAGLYEAQSQGRSVWVRLDGHRAKLARQRVGLEQALREAVQRREFEVRFSPVVRLSTGERVAVESSVVWNHAQFATVPIEAILAVAEDLGLIDAITEHVLRGAIAEMGRVPGPLFAISVPGQLLHSDTFAAQVTELLAQHSVTPSRLWLMVSEATLSSGQPAVAVTLHGLRAIGVCIQVNDFGAGPGTLEALRLVPPDGIRLSRSLVDRLGRAGTERVIRAAVAVAHTYGVEVTATGIETPEQERDLLRFGVEYGTGRLLGTADTQAAAPR